VGTEEIQGSEAKVHERGKLPEKKRSDESRRSLSGENKNELEREGKKIGKRTKEELTS